MKQTIFEIEKNVALTSTVYEMVLVESQVLIAMLNSPWIHPEVAYASCGMFPDPERHFGR